jgi:hypothetical protein
MRQAAELVWSVFIAAMFFGTWIVLIFVAALIIYGYIYHKWPKFFKKYL